MTREQLLDKIKGAVYGTAYGDAMGLGTEFMTKREAQLYYPRGLRRFSDIICDAHRSQWKQGQWTNDTDVFTLILDSIATRGDYDLQDIASRMQHWFSNYTVDIAPVLRSIINDPEWVKNPIPVAARIWRDEQIPEASNEAIQRGVIAGIIAHPEELIPYARELTLITHSDQRCVSSSVMIALTAYCILHTGEMPDYLRLYQVCERLDSRTIPYLEMAKNGNLEDLKLDDEETLAWTRKCMAAALWALWHLKDPGDMIHTVIDAAGDADTNGALVGALVGLKFGYDAIPVEKSHLLNKEYLDDIAERFTETLIKLKPELIKGV